MKRFSMFIATILAIIVLLIFYAEMRSARQNEFLAMLESDATGISREIVLNLKSSGTKLRSVISFFEGSDVIHEDELNIFVNSLNLFTEESHIRALAIMPLLHRNEVDAFLAQLDLREKSRSRLGYAPMTIKVLADRDFYAPAVYVSSPNGPMGILGYDIASNAERFETALDAQKTGRLLITPPVTLSQDERGAYQSILMIGATTAGNLGLRNYAARDNRHPTFFAISYTPGAVLADIYNSIADPRFNFSITDTTTTEKLLIYDSRATIGNAVTAKPLLSKSFEFGGREWSMDFYPTKQSLEAISSQIDILVLALGVSLLIALMLAGDRLLRNKEVLTLNIEKRTRQLNTAKKEAEKSNKAKSEFLAAMSHDLRTPLNAIMGFSEVMIQKTYGPLGDTHYEEYIEDIHSSGALLVSLINDVLDLSKIEAGKYELIEQPLEVSDLVNICVHQLGISARLAKLTLESKIPEDFPHLKGDERVLIQVLNNLISNAIKFTSEGGTVSVYARAGEHNEIIIEVSDTGQGMSGEDIEKAVRPFEQASSTYSRGKDGTGLGLYLCQNFMRLFGGKMEIESVIGEGTTVRLHFPPDRTISPVG